MSAPRVTLALSTYNRLDFLDEALASCFAQDHDDYEVLLVDDGSDERTRAVLKGLCHPLLRVVTLPPNGGLAHAHNTIGREARGELIARLGDDDVCFPDRLSRSVAVFDAEP